MASGESCQQSTNHQGARCLLRLEARNLEVLAMVFLGIDWGQAMNDACLVDGAGSVLGRCRFATSVEGLETLSSLVAQHSGEVSEVAVAIEADRGLLQTALRARGYEVYVLNPMVVKAYRGRQAASGSKSDRGDAKLLADILRADRHLHRPLEVNSGLVESIRVLARAHKAAIWVRGDVLNQLRNTLRAYYPAALEAFGWREAIYETDCLSVLSLAPSPALGRSLTKRRIMAALRAGGRRRNFEWRADKIVAALRSPQLEQPPAVVAGYAAVVTDQLRIVAALNAQVRSLERQLQECVPLHPDAEIYLSLPGLGTILAARALGEFGDDPERFASARARRNYAGTSPVTKASGKQRLVMVRIGGNRRLADLGYMWAYGTLRNSPGARRYYDAQRARGKSHAKALRALANRMVGILHGCLRHRQLYDESLAWPTATASIAA